MINLVVQSFGKETELKRAVLAVLSFYAHTSAPVEETRVVIFSDNTDYFKTWLQGLPLHFVLLTPGKIKAMRGDIDFLHRMKIALIEETFSSFDGDVLYFDSDTFFIADPMPLMRQLSPDNSFMHVHEYEFGSMKDFPLPGGASFRAYYELISNRTLKLSDGSPIKIDTTLSSWNAGVMILHSTHVALIPEVYALTEQTYPETGNHASEQYAFSIMLQMHTKLRACDSVIYHYWYRIKKQVIDEFLATELKPSFALKPIAEKLKLVLGWTGMLPAYLEKHVLTLRDNAIQNLNENKFGTGYVWAAKAMLKQPLGDSTFVRDVLYHLKRQIKK